MYSQIQNTKGEKLYIFTISNTNSIKPCIYVNTWERCINKFEMIIKELNNNNFFAQLIHKKINEKAHTAEASMRCNNKVWGDDYFQYITIEPLYIDAW